MARRMRRFIRTIMDFVHKYTLEMIILGFCGLAICWAIGYFANGLYDMKFDLASCWGGFSAIGGAGVLAAVKYCMDSWKNTPDGEAPEYDRDKNSTMREIASIGSEALKAYAENKAGSKTKEDEA